MFEYIQTVPAISEDGIVSTEQRTILLVEAGELDLLRAELNRALKEIEQLKKAIKKLGGAVEAEPDYIPELELTEAIRLALYQTPIRGERDIEKAFGEILRLAETALPLNSQLRTWIGVFAPESSTYRERRTASAKMHPYAKAMKASPEAKWFEVLLSEVSRSRPNSGGIRKAIAKANAAWDSFER